jgi:hypothetical protein
MGAAWERHVMSELVLRFPFEKENMLEGNDMQLRSVLIGNENEEPAKYSVSGPASQLRPSSLHLTASVFVQK